MTIARSGLINSDSVGVYLLLLTIVFCDSARAEFEPVFLAQNSQNLQKPAPLKKYRKPKKPFVGPPVPEKIITEKVQEGVSKRVVSLANQLDSFFGAKRADDEKNGSTLRLTPTYRVSEYNTPVNEFEIRLNLKFLNLEKEGKAIEEKLFSHPEEPEDELDYKSAGLTESEYDKEQARIRLLREQWGWNYNLENRIIVKTPLAFFSKFRIRKNFQGSPFVHRFYNEFGWASDTYWQELASFSSDYDLTKSMLFRFNNELNWLFYTNAISTSHGPSLIQNLSKQASISYDARINGVIERFDWTLDSYGPSITYRQQLENKWIFYELSPAITFSRVNNFKRALSFFIKFEFVFGDI